MADRQDRKGSRQVKWGRLDRFVATLLFWSGCLPRTEPSPVTGPEPPHDLVATAETDTPSVFEGSEAVFRASAEGGTPPYLYRWDLNDGPVELELGEVQEPALNTGPLTLSGRYVLRITITDAAGFHDSDFAAVEVLAAVATEVPPLAIIGEPTLLQATLSAGAEEAALLWEVIAGSAVFDDPASSTPLLTANFGETIEVRLTVGLPTAGSELLTSVRDFEIPAVPDLTPRVRLQTSVGPVVIELDAERAPLHAANFLKYVDDEFYDGLLFHRSVCRENPLTMECTPFVLQGGGFEWVEEELQPRVPTRDPVASEAGNGLSNSEVYSVSLALSNNNPNSGTTQFFFNLSEENSFLDDLGFTVFARAVEGTQFIDLMRQVPTEESPIIEGEMSFPSLDLVIIQVDRAEEP